MREEYTAHSLWMVAVAFALTGCAAYTVNSLIVEFAARTGVGVAVGAAALWIASSCAVVVRILAGLFLDLSTADARVVAAGLTLIGVSGFIMLAAGGPAFIVIGSAVALAGIWGWSGLLIADVTFRSGMRSGRANGIVQVGGASGGVLGPGLAATLLQIFDYRALWLVSASVAVAGGAVLARLIKMSPRRVE